MVLAAGGGAALPLVFPITLALASMPDPILGSIGQLRRVDDSQIVALMCCSCPGSGTGSSTTRSTCS